MIIENSIVKFDKSFNNNIICNNSNLIFNNDVNINHLVINNSSIKTTINNYNIEYLIIRNFIDFINNNFINNINCTKIKIYLNIKQFDTINYLKKYLKHLITNDLIIYFNNNKITILDIVSYFNIKNIKVKYKEFN